MKNVFIVESTRDHGGEDCFITFILTHGCKGYVYGTDGRKVSIEDDIVAPLCGDRCPSLSGKPKIFFVQACQGGRSYCHQHFYIIFDCVCVRACSCMCVLSHISVTHLTLI